MNFQSLFLFLSDTSAKAIWGLSAEEWQVAGTLGSIVGTAATLWAVMVALRLGRFETHPKLRVECSYLSANYSRELDDQILLFSTNVRNVPVVILGSFWRIGLFKTAIIIDLNSRNPSLTDLPKTITRGEVYSFEKTLQEFMPEMRRILEYLEEPRRGYRRFLLRTLHCEITTTGGTYRVRAPKPLRKEISRVYLESRKVE